MRDKLNTKVNLDTLFRLRKQLNVAFWDKFGGKENYGTGYTPEEKLAELIRYSKLVIFHRSKSLPRHRRQIQKTKKRLLQFPCFVCGNPGEHRHHIILLINGGHNSKFNLLTLCAGCHAKIHPWLIESPENPTSGS